MGEKWRISGQIWCYLSPNQIGEKNAWSSLMAKLRDRNLGLGGILVAIRALCSWSSGWSYSFAYRESAYLPAPEYSLALQEHSSRPWWRRPGRPPAGGRKTKWIRPTAGGKKEKKRIRRNLKLKESWKDEDWGADWSRMTIQAEVC